MTDDRNCEDVDTGRHGFLPGVVEGVAADMFIDSLVAPTGKNKLLRGSLQMEERRHELVDALTRYACGKVNARTVSGKVNARTVSLALDRLDKAVANAKQGYHEAAVESLERDSLSQEDRALFSASLLKRTEAANIINLVRLTLKGKQNAISGH